MQTTHWIAALERELSPLSLEEAAARAVRFLAETVPHYSWVGIYWVESGELVLGPWQGPAATEHVRIPIGQGICGLAAAERRTVVVDDVHADPRYLQCFPQTQSEIVVPIFAGDEVVGEIDIDSDRRAAFDAEDAAQLQAVAHLLGQKHPAASPSRSE